MTCRRSLLLFCHIFFFFRCRSLTRRLCQTTGRIVWIALRPSEGSLGKAVTKFKEKHESNQAECVFGCVACLKSLTLSKIGNRQDESYSKILRGLYSI